MRRTAKETDRRYAGRRPGADFLLGLDSVQVEEVALVGGRQRRELPESTERISLRWRRRRVPVASSSPVSASRLISRSWTPADASPAVRAIDCGLACEDVRSVAALLVKVPHLPLGRSESGVGRHRAPRGQFVSTERVFDTVLPWKSVSVTVSS